MSRKLSRNAWAIVIIVQILVYAGLAALASELYYRWHVERVRAENPYVDAFEDRTAWPVPTLNYDFASYTREWRSRGATLEEQPVSPLTEQWIRRAAFFYSTSDFCRELMPSGFGVSNFILRPDGQLGWPPSDVVLDSGWTAVKGLLGEEDAKWFEDESVTLSPGKPFAMLAPSGVEDRLTEGWRFLWRAPDGGLVGFLANADSEYDLPEDSLWEVPYLLYRPHARSANGKHLINNVRYRDDEVILPKPKGVYRILCIGGSTTEEGNFNDVTYPSLLEDRINEARQTHSFHVVNCGMAGATTEKHMLRLPDLIAMEPDRVVLYLGVNDIVYKLYHFWKWEASDFTQLVRRATILNDHFNDWFLPSLEEREAQLREKVVDRIAYIVQYLRERDIDVAIASFAYPDLENLNEDERVYYRWSNAYHWGGRYITFETYVDTMRRYNAMLKAFCSENGVDYLPVAENLKGGGEYFGDICHMKNKGIERKAEIMAEFLEPLLPSLQ